MKNIRVGETITISYIGRKCRDRDERIGELMIKWGLDVCKCAACDISEEEAEKHNKICDEYKALEIQRREFLDNAGVVVLKRPVLNEMYKLARSLKTLKKSTLLHDIVDVAFVSSCMAAINTKALGIYPTTHKEYIEDVQCTCIH